MLSKDVRVVAVRVLQELHTDGGSLTRLLPAAQQQVAETDRALLQAYCFGMARWSGRLAGIVDQLLKSGLKRKDLDIYLLMQLGVFQLGFTRMAAHAAVDTAVNAVKEMGKPWARGLVNGVLRNYQRRSVELAAGLSESANLAHPKWLLDALRVNWPAEYARTVEANNTQAAMTLRVNQHYVSTHQYRQTLSEAQIPADTSPIVDTALVLESPVAVTQLPGFDEGLVSVQDAAAQLAAGILQRVTRPGSRLLDACAAPGGKTSHALETRNWRAVTALDKDAKRLEKITETLERLFKEDGVPASVTLQAADAADLENWWDGEVFDAVLLDAPCSGTGVIRRHPDIKLLRRESDIPTLAAEQLRLLRVLWKTVAPGGFLLYATCSVLKAENEEVVGEFLKQTSNAASQDSMLCAEVEWGQARPVGRQILPGNENLDGFYYALLSKSS